MSASAVVILKEYIVENGEKIPLKSIPFYWLNPWQLDVYNFQYDL